MRNLTAIAALIAILSIGSATAASAQQQAQCQERSRLMELLANKYQERPVAMGVTHTGGLIEVLTDNKGRNWTIIITTPQGLSCLIAAGEGWRGIPANPKDLGPGA